MQLQSRCQALQRVGDFPPLSSVAWSLFLTTWLLLPSRLVQQTLGVEPEWAIIMTQYDQILRKSPGHAIFGMLLKEVNVGHV